MKFKKSTLVIMTVLALLPLALIACFYGMLPDEIPMQWGFNGSVRYDAKVNIWLMGALSPVIALVFIISPKIDPRRRNYAKFGGAYEGFCIFMLAFLLVMNGVILSESLFPGRISVYRVVTLGIGLLFIFLGNMLPKVKSNFYMGLRTPWTISDPDVWQKTNRIGGILMFIFGVIMCICPFVLNEKATFIIMMICVVLFTLIPTVMSYLLYKRSHSEAEGE